MPKHDLSGPLLLTCLILLVGSCFIGSAPMVDALQPVLGIDIGSESIKVAIARPRYPIDIVLNEQSKRKTPAVVAFRDVSERLIGNSAKALESRFPAKTFKYLNVLLGQRYHNINKTDDMESGEHEKLLKEMYERYQLRWEIPVRLMRDRERGESVDVMLVDGDTQHRFAVEELMAMLFTYLRNLAGKTPSDEELFVRDCVIAIPPYFSPLQRQAVLDAAQLAGLNVLSLMHDTTAALMQYGVNGYKSFLSMEKDENPHNVLLFDMGAAATKASVAQFRGPANAEATKQIKSRFAAGLGRIDVKSVAWDQTVGGHDLDACLADHFATVFERQHPGKRVRSHPKAMARIMQQSQKVKEILSANTETFFVIESLIDDIDFRTKITRDEFITQCDRYFMRVLEPVKKAIQSSGIDMEDINSFELIGGSSRIPYVQDMLKDYVKRDLSFSLNSDEAISFGATFRGANLSPYFQSKSFTLTDVSPYQIDFVLSKTKKQMDVIEEKSGEAAAVVSSTGKAMTLFAAGDPIMTKKTINIPRTEDFTISLRFAGGDGVPSIPISYAPEGDIEIIKIMGVERAMENFTRVLEENKDTIEPGAKTKVRVTFEIDNHGLIVLKSAQATLERIVRVKVVEDKTNSTANVNEVETSEIESYQKQKMFSRVDLKVERQPLGTVRSMNTELLNKARNRLRSMDEFDAKKSEMARERNSLESMVYDIQYQFLEDDDIKPFFNEQHKKELVHLLNEVDAWLESDDEDVQSTVDSFIKRTNEYVNKSMSIKNLVRPIQSRYDAKKEREREFSSCKKTVARTKDLIKILGQTAEHITVEERTALEKMADETLQFVETKKAEEEQHPLYEDSKTSTAEIRLECAKLSEKALELSRKPKPVVIEPTSESNTTTNSNTTQTSQDDQPTTEKQQETTEEEQKDEL